MESHLSKFQKSIIVLFNILLAVLLIWSITYTLMTSSRFYRYEFAKQNVTARTGFTELQLEIIGDHIIDYLIDEKESLQIQINGESVFSIQAIKHMEDVKALFLGIQNVLWYAFVIFVVVGIYLYVKRKEIKKYFFKVNLIVFISLVSLFIIIGLFILINFDNAFNVFHRLIFWDEQSYRDSFFSDTSNYAHLEEPGIDNRMLVKILPMGLFSDAAAIIVIGSIVILGIITLVLFINNRRSKRIA